MSVLCLRIGKRSMTGSKEMSSGETRHVCRELDKGKGGGKDGETGRTGRPEGRERGGEGLLRCGEDDVFVVLFEAFDGVFEDGA